MVCWVDQHLGQLTDLSLFMQPQVPTASGHRCVRILRSHVLGITSWKDAEHVIAPVAILVVSGRVI